MSWRSKKDQQSVRGHASGHGIDKGHAELESGEGESRVEQAKQGKARKPFCFGTFWTVDSSVPVLPLRRFQRNFINVHSFIHYITQSSHFRCTIRGWTLVLSFHRDGIKCSLPHAPSRSAILSHNLCPYLPPRLPRTSHVAPFPAFFSHLSVCDHPCPFLVPYRRHRRRL